MLRAVVLTGALLACFGAPGAQADPMLADFGYPYPVKHYEFTSQRQPLSMAYMDVAPTGEANGKAVVLLHGKNFCGATWEGQIAPLAAAGYRVVVPDQVGFCKSSKPAAYQMSLHQLAANTRALLKSIGVEKPIIIGHSMGGMLAMRYALSFPTDLSALMLVNPIGLEDWSAKGVPARTVDELFEGEKKTDAAKIKAYQLKTYYDGQWKPEYDRWVEHAGVDVCRRGRGQRGVEPGARVRHDLLAAGGARAVAHRGADGSVHRREGQYRDRQGSRAAGRCERSRQLSEARAGCGGGYSRR